MTMMGTSDSHGVYTTCCLTPQKTMYSTGRAKPTAISLMISVAQTVTAHAVMARNMAMGLVTVVPSTGRAK